MRVFFEVRTSESKRPMNIQPLTVAPESSVQETHRRISEKLGVPPEAVTLKFRGERLKDNILLTAQGVRPGCVICLEMDASEAEKARMRQRNTFDFMGCFLENSCSCTPHHSLALEPRHNSREGELVSREETSMRCEAAQVAHGSGPFWKQSSTNLAEQFEADSANRPLNAQRARSSSVRRSSATCRSPQFRPPEESNFVL